MSKGTTKRDVAAMLQGPAMVPAGDLAHSRRMVAALAGALASSLSCEACDLYPCASAGKDKGCADEWESWADKKARAR